MTLQSLARTIAKAGHGTEAEAYVVYRLTEVWLKELAETEPTDDELMFGEGVGLPLGHYCAAGRRAIIWR